MTDSNHNWDWLPAAAQRLAAGEEFVGAVVIGPSASSEFACRGLFVPDQGAFAATGPLTVLAEPLMPEVQRMHRERAAEVVTIPGPDRDLDVFVSWYGPPERVWIFGAGHIARALAPLLPTLGYAVTVCDDRAEFVTAERFPDPCERRVGEWRTMARDCAADPGGLAVLVTRGHAHDEQILRELVEAKLRYIGMIGSKRRSASVKSRLLAEGISEAFCESLHTPIGLPIGADSPAEIAIAIAAELVAVRRGPRSKTSHRVPPADMAGLPELYHRIASVLAEGKPAILCTIVDRRGSAPRGVGAQMAVFGDGSLLGTIGGGCGESEVLTAAKRMLMAAEPARLLTVDLTGDQTGESSDICGGRYTVLLEYLSPAKRR